MPDPVQALRQLEKLVSQSLPAWRRRLRAALDAHVRAVSRLATAAEAERQFFQLVRPCGVPLPITHPDRPL
eukprot:4823775-Pyramimonas_sp.AAC.1